MPKKTRERSNDSNISKRKLLKSDDHNQTTLDSFLTKTNIKQKTDDNSNGQTKNNANELDEPKISKSRASKDLDGVETYQKKNSKLDHSSSDDTAGANPMKTRNSTKLSKVIVDEKSGTYNRKYYLKLRKKSLFIIWKMKTPIPRSIDLNIQ
jgi:hypothetical protein